MDALRHRRSATKRALKDHAGAGMTENRTEFEGEADVEALLDRTAFHLDALRFSAFAADLGRPVLPNTSLRRLFTTPAPWVETDVRR